MAGVFVLADLVLYVAMKTELIRLPRALRGR